MSTSDGLFAHQFRKNYKENVEYFYTVWATRLRKMWSIVAVLDIELFEDYFIQKIWEAINRKMHIWSFIKKTFQNQ